MPEPSPLLFCPVCLGLVLEKVSIDPQGDIHIDHCRRCSGIWLEHGEVQHLRAHPQDALWKAIPRRPEPARMRCHDCHGIMERDAKTCSSCGWANHLDCPGCARPMSVETHAGLRLDVCRHCRGIWFDHHELSEIWKKSFDTSMRAREHGGLTNRAVTPATDSAGNVLLESLFYIPDIVHLGVHGGGLAADAAVNLTGGAIGAAPEVAGAVTEAAVEAAGSVFGLVVDIIASIF